MEIKKLTIRTRDEKIEHNINYVHIFVDNYSKKIKKNEFHCPYAARIIVKEKNNIFHYILLNSIVKSNNQGEINIFSPHDLDFLIGEKEYFTSQQLAEYDSLLSLYKQKQKLGLTNKEMLEYFMAKTAKKLIKILDLKIPYDIGGGF